MFQIILIAIDGSDISNHVIQSGLELAACLNASIVFANITVPYTAIAMPAYPLPSGLIPSLEAHQALCLEASKRVLGAAAELAKARAVPARGVTLAHEQPWRGILQIATQENCALICMASHGRRGLSALLLGSETQKVLTHSTLPVLVIR